MSNERLLSAILICTGQESELAETIERYMEELAELPIPYELIVVASNASEGMMEWLKPIVEDSDFHGTIVSLSRGDGSHRIVAGLQASRGDTIVLLPPYVQSGPTALHEMLHRIDEGADYVASWRHRRIDSWRNRFKSRVFNWLTRKLTGVKLHDVNSGLRMMRRSMTDSVPIYGDLFRFWPILAERQGFRVVEIKVDHIEERVVRGDYAFGVYIRRLLDLLTLFFLIKFTSKPLRFFGLLGSGLLGAGTLILVGLAIQWLFGYSLAGRPLLILGVLCMVLGVQLISLGLLGELIIFTHGKSMVQFQIETIYQKDEQPTEAPM